MRTRRPRANRNSSTTDKMPSLSHTPSSSYGTVASLERPLPRRHGFGTGHLPSKSVDLVVPTFPQDYPSNLQHSLGDASVESNASTITAIRSEDESSKSFERRKPSLNDQSQASSGLRHLFSHERMHAITNQDGTSHSQRARENERDAAAIRGL